jgi:hypothetical protein
LPTYQALLASPKKGITVEVAPIPDEMVDTRMRASAIILTVALCFAGAGLCFTDNAHMGIWKLKEGKSELSPGAPKNHTVVYELAIDNVKVTVDGTDRDGKPTRSEWTGKFDRKDYPVKGDPNSDALSYTRIDDGTLGFNFKKGGKRAACGRIEVSTDGKSRTVTMRGIDSKGKKFMSTTVYKKQ